MRPKKTKSTRKGNTGILVILLGVLFSLLILLLPPQQRHELLENQTFVTPSPTFPSGKILLRESPGTLLANGNQFYYIHLDPVSLSTIQEGQELISIDSLIVSHSIFHNNPKEIIFSTNTLDPGDIYLSFNVVKGNGILRIYLNGHIITEKEFQRGSSNPIKLPKAYFFSGQNKLTFEVSSPRVFWKVNKYMLSDISVVGNLVDLSGHFSQRSFYLGWKDIENIERIKLSYYLECDNPVVLSIWLNNNLVYTGLSSCGKRHVQDLDPSSLQQGLNTIKFMSNRNAFIDMPKIKIDYEENYYPVYYFDVSSDDIDRQFFLILKFATKDERHLLRVEINARSFTIDTWKDTYKKDITEYIEEGTNSIRLIPERDVYIRELIIEKN